MRAAAGRTFQAGTRSTAGSATASVPTSMTREGGIDRHACRHSESGRPVSTDVSRPAVCPAPPRSPLTARDALGSGAGAKAAVAA
ncbi:hypothetical protein [Streptomyces sp. Go40/10]|uniref:hypothetical protein n=1 Tax=Streptomyces sp. Go40/10 TaxID=2825844 RepID=UPI002F417539